MAGPPPLSPSVTPLDPSFPSLDRLSVAALTLYSSFEVSGLSLCFLPCPALPFSFLPCKVPESPKPQTSKTDDQGPLPAHVEKLSPVNSQANVAYFKRSGTFESDHVRLDPESSLCVSPGK